MVRERVDPFFNRARNEVMICGPKVVRHEDGGSFYWRDRRGRAVGNNVAHYSEALE